jgi:hypothetical protein
MALLLAIAPAASAREWTDTTGGFSVEAELVEVKDDKVRLKKPSGQVVAVPIAKLSKGDREYIASLVKTKGKPDDEKQKEAVYQGKTVSQWVEALKDKDDRTRRGAAIALGQIGPAAKDAVPALIEVLKDKDDRVRNYAASALGKIGPAAVPALMEALKDKDINVRNAAVRALGQIGPAAKAAVPSLKAMSENDTSAYARGAAARALKQIEK